MGELDDLLSFAGDLADGVDGLVRLFRPEGPAEKPDHPTTVATLRQALAQHCSAVEVTAMGHLVHPDMTPEQVDRVRERVKAAIAFGWVLHEGREITSRLKWRDFVDLCAGDPDVAGRIAMAVYAKAGFVSVAEIGFFRRWAKAARQAKALPAFMTREK